MFIYKITNQVNGKIYIGLDGGPNERNTRWSSHKTASRSQTKKTVIHFALHKHGIENFKYEIIEYCSTKDDLSRQEKYWIGYFQSDKREFGYNRTAGGELTFWATLTPDQRDDRIKMMSENAKLRLSELTEDERKEKANHLKEYHKTLSSEKRSEYASYGGKGAAKRFSKTFLIYTPSNEIFTITGLREFCRNNTLCRTGMLNVSTGESQNYKGWRCYNIDEQGKAIIPELKHKPRKVYYNDV